MYTNVTNRSKIWLVAVLAVLFCLPGIAKAQGNFTPSELDTLVANIALYPDPLLVQVLAASTYGEQIHPAAKWAEAHRHLKGRELSASLERANLPYDASVQALIPFPQVLTMMDRYPAWTDQLGDAVAMQKDDVMASIQRLRRTASKYGHLRSDERVKVSNGDNITITPVRTEYVYVPVYNPYYVYYRYYDGYVRITYGPEVWTGGFGYWGWGTCWFDWNMHVIYVHDRHWRPHRHYPRHPPRYAPPPPPRRYDDRPHHAAPPPRRGHDVGPAMGQSSAPAKMQFSSKAVAGKDARKSDRNFDSHERQSPPRAPAPRSEPPRSQSVSKSQFEEDGARISGRSGSNDDYRDDRDSRSERGSSRGFGKPIQRR